jgi:hypothetical protein
MQSFKSTFVFSLLLILGCFILAAPQTVKAEESMRIGIYVFESLEGFHTPSSTFGTHLGSLLLPVCKNIKVEDAVPLQTNETVRILDELTADRKVVWTTLRTFAQNGAVDYPSIVFADDSIVFKDLTWKVDDEKSVELAKKADLTHCLIGTCTGYARPPSQQTSTGRHGLSVVTASVNVRLVNLGTGTQEWMKNYRQIVPHADPRVAFEQAIEMVAETIAEDLGTYFKDVQNTDSR